MTTAAPATPPDLADLEILTDEELAVLDDTEPIAVRPRFDALPAGQQDVARQVAFRGLVARGIVDTPTPDAVAAAGTGGSPHARVDVLVRRDVQSLVTLRRGAALVVALARTTGADRDFWYAYPFDDLALVEQVTTVGLHRFTLVRGERLLDQLVAAAVHPHTADAAGPPLQVPDGPPPGPPPPVLQMLGSALLRVDMVVRSPGRPTAQTAALFTGPTGAWLVTHRTAEPSIAFPMRAHDLREHVRATVREAHRTVQAHRG